MPKSHQVEPDLTSVRTLIPSVTKLANACRLTTNGIYRWIKVNRIPAKHLNAVANFYDVELRDLMMLTGSEKSYVSKALTKPKGTLDALVQVHAGQMTLEAAAALLDTPVKALKMVMFHWGDELPTLHKTMQELDACEISLETACERLGVTKYTLHGIRQKYGYAPGAIPMGPSGLAKLEQKARTKERREKQRQLALEVLAGKLTAKEAAHRLGMSYRTMFRSIDRLSAHKIQDLTGWPQVFKEALSVEMDVEMPKYTEKWLDFVNKQRLFIGKNVKYPKSPKNWKGLPLKRLLVGVLLGEATLDEIAASRGADPSVLKGLFTGDLRPLGVTYAAAVALPIEHQLAIVAILLASLDRKRVVPDSA